MRIPTTRLIVTASALALSACVSFSPENERPAAPVPAIATYAEGGQAATTGLDWRALFTEPEMAALIEAALSNNRDLRQVLYDVERVRSLYRIERSSLVPDLAASGTYSYNRLGPDAQAGGFGTGVPVGAPVTEPGEGTAAPRDAVEVEQVGLSAGVAAYELDLFGRLRNLSDQALQQYLASEAGARSAEVAIVASVAQAYLQLVADRELLLVAQQTVESQREALDLTTMRIEGGVGTELDRQSAILAIERARADAAALQAQVRADENALRLLVGEPSLPVVSEEVRIADVSLGRDLPAAVPSGILLRRPDVLAAERRLYAANADIGAARAAFFPQVTLTGSGGVASASLDDLFSGGTGVWSFAPRVTVPIFTGGALRGNLGRARASQGAAQAAYEGTVQTAFREVADALAVRATIQERLNATRSLAEAASLILQLSEDRYEAGVSGYLDVLVAQREDYQARRQLVAVLLAEASNIVSLYQAMGGAPVEPGALSLASIEG